jgi:hypothetical protein
MASFMFFKRSILSSVLVAKCPFKAKDDGVCAIPIKGISINNNRFFIRIRLEADVIDTDN